MRAEFALPHVLSLAGGAGPGHDGTREWTDQKGPGVRAALDSFLRLYPEENMATDAGQGSLTRSHI